MVRHPLPWRNPLAAQARTTGASEQEWPFTSFFPRLLQNMEYCNSVYILFLLLLLVRAVLLTALSVQALPPKPNNLLLVRVLRGGDS